MKKCVNPSTCRTCLMHPELGERHNDRFLALAVCVHHLSTARTILQECTGLPSHLADACHNLEADLVAALVEVEQAEALEQRTLEAGDFTRTDPPEEAAEAQRDLFQPGAIAVDDVLVELRRACPVPDLREWLASRYKVHGDPLIRLLNAVLAQEYFGEFVFNAWVDPHTPMLGYSVDLNPLAAGRAVVRAEREARAQSEAQQRAAVGGAP